MNTSPSCKWYRSICSRTNRLRDSFYTQAIIARLLNSQPMVPELSVYTHCHSHTRPSHFQTTHTDTTQTYICTHTLLHIICCCYSVLYFTPYLSRCLVTLPCLHVHTLSTSKYLVPYIDLVLPVYSSIHVYFILYLLCLLLFHFLNSALLGKVRKQAFHCKVYTCCIWRM